MSVRRLLTGLFFVALWLFARAGMAQQVLQYPLSADFNEQEGRAAALQPIANNDGLTGRFGTQSVSSATCNNVDSTAAWFFEDDAGLQFNNAGFIDCQYALEMTFKIDEVPVYPPWVRLLSFTHTNDHGLYIYFNFFTGTGTLEFWPNGRVGTAGFFNNQDFFQLTLTRECDGGMVVYVNGQQFATYDDSNTATYLPQQGKDYIIFFRDHPSVLANEASPGWVRNIVIADRPWAPDEVTERWEDFCNRFEAPEEPVDCLGVVNGAAVLDSCGVCRLPDDADFNSTCTDCLGVVNGAAIPDSCGVCRLPDDADFNSTCTDCLGVVNGAAVTDSCGVCRLPDDPDFATDCLLAEEEEIYFPDAFSPNGDGLNDTFEPKSARDWQVAEMLIYNRWGRLVYYQSDFSLSETSHFWNGSGAPSGVYVYKVIVSSAPGEPEKIYQGQVQLLR